MPKRTRSFRSWQLEKLADPKRAASYLNTSIQESPEQFLIALGKVAQANRMSKVAEGAGVQRETLYRSLSEKGNPTFGTLTSVLAMVGLKLSITRVDEDSTEPSLGLPATVIQKQAIAASIVISGTTSSTIQYNTPNQQMVGILKIPIPKLEIPLLWSKGQTNATIQ